MPIGGPRQIGSIGNSAKRKGPIGSPTTAYVSSLTVDTNKLKSHYPTTSTAAVTTTTALVTTTTTAITTTTSS